MEYSADLYPPWKQRKSTTSRHESDGTTYQSDIEHAHMANVTTVSYERTVTGPDGEEEPVKVVVPAADYDWAIDPAGNVVPMVMATNRAGSRIHSGNHESVQTDYKRGKAVNGYRWLIFKINAEKSNRAGKKINADGQTVDEWLKAHAKEIEKRQAKHARDMAKRLAVPSGAGELASEVARILKTEREAWFDAKDRKAKPEQK